MFAFLELHMYMFFLCWCGDFEKLCNHAYTAIIFIINVIFGTRQKSIK